MPEAPGSLAGLGGVLNGDCGSAGECGVLRGGQDESDSAGAAVDEVAAEGELRVADHQRQEIFLGQEETVA
jgi:hypothetical protein